MFDKASAVAIIKDNKVLLGKRKDGQGWSLAGGKMEAGEKPIHCAKRELFEEFGLTAIDIEYVGQVVSTAYVKGKKQEVKPHIFICTNFSGDIKLAVDEMQEYKWMTISEIMSQNDIFPPSLEAVKLINNNITM